MQQPITVDSPEVFSSEKETRRRVTHKNGTQLPRKMCLLKTKQVFNCSENLFCFLYFKYDTERQINFNSSSPALKLSLSPPPR